jgi:hypothetical protein
MIIRAQGNRPSHFCDNSHSVVVELHVVMILLFVVVAMVIVWPSSRRFESGKAQEKIVLMCHDFVLSLALRFHRLRTAMVKNLKANQ